MPGDFDGCERAAVLERIFPNALQPLGQRGGRKASAAVERAFPYAPDDNILLIRAGYKVRFWGDIEGKRFPAFKRLPFCEPADGAVRCLGGGAASVTVVLPAFLRVIALVSGFCSSCAG